MRTSLFLPVVAIVLLTLPQPSFAQEEIGPGMEVLPNDSALGDAGLHNPGGPRLDGSCAACGEADCISCGGPDCFDCCGGGCSARPWTFFGEYLYLRPHNAEVVYAVPFNGPVTAPPDVPIQIGAPGVIDPGYDAGVRVGFSRTLADCGSSLGATYTHLSSTTSDQISTSSPYVLRSMVVHPSTLQASSDGLDAYASAGIDLDRADVDFRRVFLCGDQYELNYLIGAGYAGLDQRFRSQFGVNGLETVRTDIRFDGGGIRLGLEGERRSCHSGLMIYGRGIVSFVAGEFRGTYAQGQAFDASVVDTGWKTGRIVSILDLELGLGWSSPSGCLRFTAGYLVSAWCNAVKTDELIQAVQSNNFVGLGDTLTFDGLAFRTELRF